MPKISSQHLSGLVARAESALDNINTLLGEVKNEMTSSTAKNPYEGPLHEYISRYQISLEEIAEKLSTVKCSRVMLTQEAYKKFLTTVLTNHEDISPKYYHKKKLELFISFSLLDMDSQSIYLDAAGGGFSYAGKIQCMKSYLQDMEIRTSVKKRVGAHVNFIESNLTNIPLPDNSVNAISCHHAFEHFQSSADTDFIVEAQRILKPGGSLVIVPIFISHDNIEMTNKADFDNWSTGKEQRIYDPKATLPGNYSGHFARIYDVETLGKRVLSQIDTSKMEVEIIEPLMGGLTIPDTKFYTSHKISNFNFPYRALKLHKKLEAS